jgi:flagellar motor switch protein FliG
LPIEKEKLKNFLTQINNMSTKNQWEKEEIVRLFEGLIPEFQHIETKQYLDQKM